MIDVTKLDAFTLAYLEAALWSSHDQDNEGDMLDARYSFHDFAPETLADFAQDCEAFQRDHAKDLGDAYEGSVRYNDELAGHDYWLTRNGHGAGFWDRGLGPVGDRLSDACRHHPIDLYVHEGKVTA